jgi:hypothetical protein
MRTKTLICAAAIVAAGALSAMAQSNVYSLNVVGYVNVPTTGGANFNCIANPLNNANNGITNLFPPSFAQDGDQVYRWNAANQDLDGTVYTYSTFLASWDGNVNVRPGEGIFYVNAGANRTNTFVGDVVQGSYTNPVPILGGASFNLIASSVPIGGSFTNAIGGITAQDGDQVYTWNVPAQDLDGTVATYSTFLGKWDNTAINVNPGIGFFYVGAGPNQNPWVRNFTVPQ